MAAQCGRIVTEITKQISKLYRGFCDSFQHCYQHDMSVLETHAQERTSVIAVLCPLLKSSITLL